MAPNPEPSGFSTLSFNNSTGQTRASQKKDNKGRKFFQQMQPTFSIDVPTTSFTKLEFLDNFDPAKDTVVRKKAREWVNKNREITNLGGQAIPKSRSKNAASKAEDEGQKKQLAQRKSTTPALAFDLPKAVDASSVDPFGILPNIGRDFDHIIKYFLSANCPEEIPCSDDKYADKSKHALVPFQHENTVLGNMAKSELTFVLWLYATVIIRDGMSGNFNTEEVYWFYSRSLKVMQETLERETAAGSFSDYLINAVSCITAAAVFSGMFKTAVLHRDALVRLLTLRGDGDILVGWQSTGYFTRKASQWCEIMVAAQLAEIPKIPRQPQGFSPLPDHVILATDALTVTTLGSLPPLAEPFTVVIRYLHQVAVSYASPPPDIKIDDYIIQPMYNAQHALLRILAAQKEPEHGFSDVEVLLAEAFQLYFWIGTRGLPPQTRLCELLISRVMKSLLPLLLEASTELSFETGPVMAAAAEAKNNNTLMLPKAKDHLYRFLRHPRQVNNAITWALALGTLATAPLLAPEHSWFKDRFQLQLRAMALHREKNHWLAFLSLFPTTEGYPNPWIDLKSVWHEQDAIAWLHSGVKLELWWRVVILLGRPLAATMATTLAIPQSGLTPRHRHRQPPLEATSWSRAKTSASLRIRHLGSAIMSNNDAVRPGSPQPRLFIRETYFQTPKPVLPPGAVSMKGMTPTIRYVSATPTLPPRKESQHKRLTEETMVYETVTPSAVTFEDNKTLRERIDTLCRSACTALLDCVCPLPSGELGDEESSTARMLMSYRYHPPYGYGSISAGPTPTGVSEGAWSTIPWRRRSSDSLVAQPTPQGNTVRS